jgi:DNA-binding response OmpR family regulator
MKKLLVVEDDNFLQNLEAQKFSKEGFDVLHAGGQAEFEKVIATDTPDAALLDVLLPDGDGFHILEELRKNPKTANIPIIMFSNMSETADLERGKSLGATDFMVKAQFTLDEIVEKIKELVK